MAGCGYSVNESIMVQKYRNWNNIVNHDNKDLSTL